MRRISSRIVPVIGVALLLSACAEAEPEADAPVAEAEAGTDAEVETVMQMVDAWNTRDWDRVANLFAEDGVLHSMMIAPVEGREAIRERISGLGEGLEEMNIDIRNIGKVNDVVFLERFDEFTYNGTSGRVPVVGVLEVENGEVVEWREYYDRAELIEAMGLEEDFDQRER